MKKKIYSAAFSFFLLFANFYLAQAANVNISTSALAADTIYQATNNNIVYIVKMDVTTTTVTVNNIQYTVSGTHDADDFTATAVYFNTTPSLTGASYLNQTSAAFAAPHTYSLGMSRQVAAGTTGYFIIIFNTGNTATDNNTIQVNGASNPVVFSYTTATTVTNSQTNGAGLQTIQAADITLSSAAVAADTIYQATNSNIIYIVKMKNSKMTSVAVNNIQYTVSGNHDADDLTVTAVYFNTTPSLTGASYINQTSAAFAAPHTYSLGMYKLMNRGDSGYFIITVNTSNTATDEHTIRITGNTNPVLFSYATAPNVSGTQTNSAGLQTIQAADITLSTNTVAAGNIARNTNSNIVYIAKVSVSAMADVAINNIQYTLSGTHDADDLTITTVYFNTIPSLTGAGYLNQTAATFAGPHTYSLGMYKLMSRGTSGYFIITVNVNAAATLGHTVQVNGAVNPAVFSYATAPNVTNSQTNAAGVKTISATLAAVNTSAGNNGGDAVKAPAFEVNVYPNPASDWLKINFTSGTVEMVKWKICNASGTAVKTDQHKVLTGSNEINIDTRSLPAGTYYITLMKKDGMAFTKKVFIRR